MLGKYGALILAGVVTFGAVIWWLTTDTDTALNEMVEEAEMNPPAQRDTADDETEAPRGTGSMRDLLMRDESMECIFTFSDEEVEGEGTGFFDGERMRMDSMMEIDGVVYNASYIYVDEEMYMWGEMPEGEFAMTMPVENPSSLDESADDIDTPVGVDEDVSYECDSWSVDNSVFTPPASIEFMDMGAMMEGMMQGGSDGPSEEEMEAMMEQMEGSMPAQ